MPVLTTLSNVVFSAYCACRICCGPDASGVTSLGNSPVQGRTIAAPRNIPLQTNARISVKGYTKTYRVEDRTALKWDGKRWDIYFHDHETAKKFGVQRGTVTILTTTPKGKKKK